MACPEEVEMSPQNPCIIHIDSEDGSIVENTSEIESAADKNDENSSEKGPDDETVGEMSRFITAEPGGGSNALKGSEIKSTVGKGDENSPGIEGCWARCKNWWKQTDRVRLLTSFFIFHVFWPYVDMGSDVWTGIEHVRSGNSFAGKGTFLIMFFPGMAAILTLVCEKATNPKSDRKWTEIFYKIPFAQPVKNYTSFEKLCEMDTALSQNKSKVAELEKEAGEGSSFEAYYESAPQLILQLSTFWWTGNLDNEIQIFGMFISFFTLVQSSTLVFFRTRNKENADISPSWKLQLWVAPVMAILVLLSVTQWCILLIFLKGWISFSFPPIILIHWFFLYSVCCFKQKQTNLDKNSESDLNLSTEEEKNKHNDTEVPHSTFTLMASIFGVFVPSIVGDSNYILPVTTLVSQVLKLSAVIIFYVLNPLETVNILKCVNSNETTSNTRTCDSFSNCFSMKSEKTNTLYMDESNLNWTTLQGCFDAKSCFYEINSLMEQQEIPLIRKNTNMEVQRLCDEDYIEYILLGVIIALHVLGLISSFLLVRLSNPANMYRYFSCLPEYIHHIFVFEQIRNEKDFNLHTDKMKKNEINRVDYDGNSILHLLIIHGKSDNYDKYDGIMSRIDINLQNKQGKTALMLAYEKHDDKMFKKLCGVMDANGLLAKDAVNGDTILHIMLKDVACSPEKIKETAKIISTKFSKENNFSVLNLEGKTPLEIAVERGNREILAEILKIPADINLKNSSGRNPLQIAFLMDREDIVIELINYGADVNITDNYVDTLLFWAVKKENDKLVELLLYRGADINKAEKNGYTPLVWAVLIENDKLVKLLVDRGADINKADNDGETPLAIAKRISDKRIRSRIIDILEAHMSK